MHFCSLVFYFGFLGFLRDTVAGAAGGVGAAFFVFLLASMADFIGIIDNFLEVILIYIKN